MSMAFVVLSKAGLETLAAGPVAAGTVLHVNATLAGHAELAALRAAGAVIKFLPPHVDAENRAELAAALRQGDAGGVLWIENGTPDARQSPLPVTTARKVSSAVKRAMRFVGRTLQSPRSMMIVPFIGYGNATAIRFSGRVLDERAAQSQALEDSAMRNFAALYQRLESDEVAGATVRASLGKRTWEAVTDEGGYFHFDVTFPEDPLPGGWRTVHLELVREEGAAHIKADADIMITAGTARFGIISDIDDTVLWTNVTNKINMALMLARSNAFTRKPFKGVAAFYEALHNGAAGNEANPVFYVSNSPWHLFEPLRQFMQHQNIPKGPILLRELRLRSFLKSETGMAHKLDSIERILTMYPALPFVLIGDSGERDPEIYAEVLRRHPQSVRAIYIRNVNPDPARIEALDKLAGQVSAGGAQLILAADSIAAATHAAAEGLIRTDALAGVRMEKLSDD